MLNTFKSGLTVANYERFVTLVAGEVTLLLEKVVLKSTFSRLGKNTVFLFRSARTSSIGSEYMYVCKTKTVSHANEIASTSGLDLLDLPVWLKLGILRKISLSFTTFSLLFDAYIHRLSQRHLLRRIS